MVKVTRLRDAPDPTCVCRRARRMIALACYLLRDDGEWYALGDHYRWGTAFAVFNGPADGSVHLAPADAHVLALRLDDYGHNLQTRERIAEDIIRWCQRPEKP